MAASGVLWLVYALFRIEPLGAAVAWREELGYSEILQTGRWVLYNLPGALAVALSAWAGLMVVARRIKDEGRNRLSLLGRGVLAATLGFATLAVLGMAVHFDPLVTGGLSFGTLSIGIGMLLGGIGAKAGAASPYDRAPSWMIVVGLLAILSIATWPLVYAIQLLPSYTLVIVYAVFASCWAVLGFSIRGVLSRSAGSGGGRP